jgi:SMP-30/gluconolaconase/LRE-like protein
MLRHYPSPSLLLALAGALTLGLSGCKPRDAGNTATADSAAARGPDADASPDMARKIAETTGLSAPESALYDRSLDVWFVSNINGDPTGKDNNGFISRIAPDGKVYSLKFIEAGKKGVTLNAPKGMAVSGDTLWVADIDALRAFNSRTGAPITSVTAAKAKFLNDVAVGPDGTLYVTDTGVIPDPKTGLKHTGPDRIYQVKGRKASVALESAQLAGPNGIAWVKDEDGYVVVPFFGSSVFVWRPGSDQLRSIGSGPGQLDGVEPLDNGRLLISSWADSSLFVLDKGRNTKVATGIASPADIGVKDNVVAVPQLMENRLQLLELP